MAPPKTQAVMYPKLVHRPPFTVEAPGYEPVKGETIPRRNPIAKDGLITRPDPETATIFDIIKRGAQKFGNAKAVGSRNLIKLHEEVKKVKKMVDGKEQEVDKKWTYFELSEYHYLSFIEYERLTLQIGAGLRKLGAVSQSMPMVTAYDTLGEDGLRHSMVQTYAKAIYLDPHLLPTLSKVLSAAKEVKYVVYNEKLDLKQEHIDQIKSSFEHITVISVEELRKLGEANPVDPTPPLPEDLCCIMYTSGSTGTPKGVPLTHKNVIASIAGVTAIVGQYLGPGDALLTYLPLAHILEFVFENCVIYWGGVMGYGSPKTLSDTSTRNCKGDIREFKPTVLVGVPAVWESVKKGIIGKVSQGSPLVQRVFWGAMGLKSFLMGSGLPGSAVLDSIVFNKVKDATGGRLRIMMNGGGPVAKETQHFLSMAITPMIIGYGLTETAAMGALMDPLEWTDQAIGGIPASAEVKLVDFPDAGYFAASNPPQGEIWIRSDSIMSGYYENEKETAEALTSDGWFKSGDIGEFDKNGHLRIIDRKKNLIKMAHGEYIALEKLESVYRSTTVVANICVHADPQKAKPVAIIVPAEPALKALAKSHGIAGDSVEELVQNKKLQEIVLKELQKQGRSGGLASIEIIDGVVMADEEWTPQNGLVTSAQKLNRRIILEKYKTEVESAYHS
ncbi:MAG: long-chain fatty acid-CoA ligase [Vezdaea aestivalis]|nr:MAG: long-chain fatty acid-CoA ligase [Vezdaea aestivalis]